LSFKKNVLRDRQEAVPDHSSIPLDAAKQQLEVYFLVTVCKVLDVFVCSSVVVIDDCRCQMLMFVCCFCVVIVLLFLRRCLIQRRSSQIFLMLSLSTYLLRILLYIYILLHIH